MAKSTPKLAGATPKDILRTPLKADWQGLLKALSKGVGHATVGKWEELGTDAVEALSSIGLAKQPGELASLLVNRALIRSFFDLVADSASGLLLEAKGTEDQLLGDISATVTATPFYVDSTFLDRPADLRIVIDAKPLLSSWLKLIGVAEPSANAISDRLPAYFVYALNQEWRRNAKSYQPILDAASTPFTRAGEREWAWTAYASLLNRRIYESAFDEPFSLAQLYVPINAYYVDAPDRRGEPIERNHPNHKNERRIVVRLEDEVRNLTGADLRSATLFETNLRHAQMNGANLTKVKASNLLTEGLQPDSIVRQIAEIQETQRKEAEERAKRFQANPRADVREINLIDETDLTDEEPV